MNTKSYEKIIDEAWNNKNQVNSKSDKKIINAIHKTIDLLDSGKIRVAEKKNNQWHVNQWIKKAILLSFRINKMKTSKGPYSTWYDKIDGKKIIFTNGSKKHAINVTKQIGIDQLFDDIFDIVDAEFIPKPAIQPYNKLVKKHKIDPNLCVFVEDIARNLKPAYEMGMTTVWIENDEPWAKKFSDENFVNYKTNNLSEFLKKINLLKAA